MLRIIHTADIHLGARHDDLGIQAAAQRDRQFAAFRATVELALAEKVDLFLIAGDLFDSNVQPRRSVERVAEELKRLAAARIRTVIIPGTHDVYDRTSIYRAYDLKAMAGSTDHDDLVTVLTPDLHSVHLAALDAVVHGRVFDTKRAPVSPLAGLDAGGEATGATWRIGMVHGSIAIPGKTDRDEVVITTDEIANSRLDYLALGHWHSTQQGRAGAVAYAYAGAPEAVALDQDRAGKVLLVELEDADGKRTVTIEDRIVGRTTFQRVQLDAATIETQPALIAGLAKRADPDLVLDVRIVGVRPDELDLAHRRDRVGARPVVPQGPGPRRVAARADRGHVAVARHRRRRLHPRSGGADRRARGDRQGRRGGRAARLAAPRPAAAGRPRGLAVRIRKLELRDFRRYRHLAIDLAPGLTVVRGPNEAGKSTIQRAIELAITRRVTSSAGDLDAFRPWDAAEDARSIITVDFEQDDEDGAKVGQLEKTFAGSKGTVRLDYDGQSVTDPALADQILAELTGIPTEAFFRSTASVRHHELADLGHDEGALRDRLQASISGGDRGTSRAKRKLEGAIHGLTPRATRTRAPSRSPRPPLPGPARRSNRVTLRWPSSPAIAMRSRVPSSDGPRPRRASPSAAACWRRRVRPSASPPNATPPRIATSGSGRRSRSNDQIAVLAATHPSANALPVLRSGVERVRALDQKARELQAALAGNVPVTFEIEAEPSWRPLSRWGIALTIIGVVIAGGSIALDLLGDRGPGYGPEPHRRDHRRHRPGPRRGRAVDAPRLPHGR